MGPLTTALKAAKAERVDPEDFRAPRENASLLRPLIGRGFQVWRLQERIARDGNVSHDWPQGVRPGPNASGAYSQRVFDLGATHPGIRGAGFREVMEVLRGPGKAGYPPSLATDSQLGFSVMAYRLAELLFGRCGGDGHISVR